MPHQLPELEIGALTVPQRLDLIGQLWDSISDTAEAVPMPEWHCDELDRRLAAADTDPNAGIPWEKVKARLRQKP